MFLKINFLIGLNHEKCFNLLQSAALKVYEDGKKPLILAIDDFSSLMQQKGEGAENL